MEIERRILIRFSGEEAESLVDLLKYIEDRSLEYGDERSAKWFAGIKEKLEAGLGRANRLQKVLRENPPNHMKPGQEY